MAEVDVNNVYEDLEELKRDVAIIKHILSEEGELTDIAKKRLERARKTPIKEYVKL